MILRCPRCRSTNTEEKDFSYICIDGKNIRISYCECLDCGKEFEKKPFENRDYFDALKLIKEKGVEVSYVLDNDEYEDYLKDMEHYFDVMCRSDSEERKKKWLASWCLTVEEWDWLRDVFETIR